MRSFVWSQLVDLDWLSLSTSERLAPPPCARHLAPRLSTFEILPDLDLAALAVAGLTSTILPLRDHDTTQSQHNLLCCASRVWKSTPWLFLSFWLAYFGVLGLFPGCFTFFQLLPLDLSVLEAHSSSRLAQFGTSFMEKNVQNLFTKTRRFVFVEPSSRPRLSLPLIETLVHSRLSSLALPAAGPPSSPRSSLPEFEAQAHARRFAVAHSSFPETEALLHAASLSI